MRAPKLPTLALAVGLAAAALPAHGGIYRGPGTDKAPRAGGASTGTPGRTGTPSTPGSTPALGYDGAW
ncbi:MAG: hypothetical protein R3F30_10270 [Planctomycetota bacterium]